MSSRHEGWRLPDQSKPRIRGGSRTLPHLKSGKLAGAAVDVFPQEPESGGAFVSPLRGLANVILTPISAEHGRGEQNIGQFVSARMVDYFKSGNSQLSVNLRSASRLRAGMHRLTHMHHNVPGILRAINDILADQKSILSGRCWTRAASGYAITNQSGLRRGLLAKLRRFRTRSGCGCRETREVRVRLQRFERRGR